jgi:hypothetical protein
MTLPNENTSMLVDGTRAGRVTWPGEQGVRGFLRPIGGGPRVRLPDGFSPDAITDAVVVGDQPETTDGRGRRLLVDAATGHTVANLGAGSELAVGHGPVLWTDCTVTELRPCTLRCRSVTGAPTSSDLLPRSPSYTAGVVSPDGRMVAFTLERATQDPRYDDTHPLPPANVAILHLDTLDVVPGVELQRRYRPR